MGNEMFVYKNNRRLRSGYTTGTCAAAASKAAALMLLTQSLVDRVSVDTPKGVTLELPVEEPSIRPDRASCAVRKDGGDDVDATDGLLIFSEVSFSDSPGITVDGGRGVGRVTRKGLDQPPGEAAINSTPRRMICESVSQIAGDLGCERGLSVVVSVPEGETAADRTFNPRMGICGGISIIGTSGIVEPMSEKALIDTIRAEISMRTASGHRYILAVPGNYGADYACDSLGLPEDDAVRCSNFIGETVDGACEFGASGLLIVGNLGKMVKVAGGIMNTHSRSADCRMEILTANAMLCGGDAPLAERMMSCVTTDDALGVLKECGMMEPTMDRIIGRMQEFLDYRCRRSIEVGAVVFSSEYGLLGMTEGARGLMRKIKGESA